MPTIKPFQAIIMGAFGLIALLGLFLFANFQGFNSGVKPIGAVVIWGTLPAESVSSAITSLKQTHSEYGSVTYRALPEDSFGTDLAEGIASGVGPDLLIISQEDLLATKNKISLIPSSSLSERTFRDSYLPITELYLTEGGTYGIPFVVDPLMLYYNRPVLGSAGVARPPATWEAVTGLASVVNKQTDAQVITRSLIAFGSYENVEHARAILSLLFLQAGYPITELSNEGMRATLSESTGQVFGTSPAESALNFYTEFANPLKTVYSWNRSLPESRQAFLAGDLALYLGYASERRMLTAANPNLDFDMAPAPVPGTATTRITFGKAYAFALPRSSKNPDGAFRVAMGLSGVDVLPQIAHSLGMVPARSALLIPTKDDLFEPVYFPEALVARGWLSPAPTDTDRIFATMVGNVISGRESVRSALYTADTALDAALR